jgi:hypothetical protein
MFTVFVLVLQILKCLPAGALTITIPEPPAEPALTGKPPEPPPPPPVLAVPAVPEL